VVAVVVIFEVIATVAVVACVANNDRVQKEFIYYKLQKVLNHGSKHI
jgi:hypothetical protein